MLWRCAKNAYLEYRYEKEYFGDVGDRGEIMGYAALFDEWQDDDAWRPLYDDADIGSAGDCSFRIKGFAQFRKIHTFYRKSIETFTAAQRQSVQNIYVDLGKITVAFA